MFCGANYVHKEYNTKNNLGQDDIELTVLVGIARKSAEHTYVLAHRL